jgi:hypothetical protein
MDIWQGSYEELATQDHLVDTVVTWTPRDGLSQLRVASGQSYSSFRVRGARPWWLRWRGPLSGPSLLFESRSDPRGSDEAESLPASLDEAGPAPEGSGDMEPMPEGSGEPETPSVGPDWAATTLITVLDELRLMSFNSCPTGTLILVPDT